MNSFKTHDTRYKDAVLNNNVYLSTMIKKNKILFYEKICRGKNNASKKMLQFVLKAIVTTE